MQVHELKQMLTELEEQGHGELGVTLQCDDGTELELVAIVVTEPFETVSLRLEFDDLFAR